MKVEVSQASPKTFQVVSGRRSTETLGPSRRPENKQKQHDQFRDQEDKQWTRTWKLNKQSLENKTREILGYTGEHQGSHYHEPPRQCISARALSTPSSPGCPALGPPRGAVFLGRRAAIERTGGLWAWSDSRATASPRCIRHKHRGGKY